MLLFRRDRAKLVHFSTGRYARENSFELGIATREGHGFIRAFCPPNCDSEPPVAARKARRGPALSGVEGACRGTCFSLVADVRPTTRRFVSGHDFSRADRMRKPVHAPVRRNYRKPRRRGSCAPWAGKSKLSGYGRAEATALTRSVSSSYCLAGLNCIGNKSSRYGVSLNGGPRCEVRGLLR